MYSKMFSRGMCSCLSPFSWTTCMNGYLAWCVEDKLFLKTEYLPTWWHIMLIFHTCLPVAEDKIGYYAQLSCITERKLEWGGLQRDFTWVALCVWKKKYYEYDDKTSIWQKSHPVWIIMHSFSVNSITIFSLYSHIADWTRLHNNVKFEMFFHMK